MSNKRIKIFNTKYRETLEEQINFFLSKDKIGLIDIKYYAIPSDIEQWKDERMDSIMMRHDCIFTALVIYREII